MAPTSSSDLISYNPYTPLPNHVYFLTEHSSLIWDLRTSGPSWKWGLFSPPRCAHTSYSETSVTSSLSHQIFSVIPLNYLHISFNIGFLLVCRLFSCHKDARSLRTENSVVLGMYTQDVSWALITCFLDWRNKHQVGGTSGDDAIIAPFPWRDVMGLCEAPVLPSN